jgi:hypothetical protein
VGAGAVAAGAGGGNNNGDENEGGEQPAAAANTVMAAIEKAINKTKRSPQCLKQEFGRQKELGADGHDTFKEEALIQVWPLKLLR